MAQLISLTLAKKANDIPVTLAEDHETVSAFEAMLKKTKSRLYCDANAPSAVLEVPDKAAKDAIKGLAKLPLIEKGVVICKPGANLFPRAPSFASIQRRPRSIGRGISTPIASRCQPMPTTNWRATPRSRRCSAG